MIHVPIIALLVCALLMPAAPLARATPQGAAQEEATAARDAFARLDEILAWEGDRYGTLGPSGKRLFTDRIEEAPGLRGTFSYLGPTPGFRDPVVLEFRDEHGPLAARHVRTAWRPSYLEVHWALERPPGSSAAPPGGVGAIQVVELKFITHDDALADRVRVINATTEPVVVEAVASGGMTPLLERFRSRQIHVDLSEVANLTPHPGRRIFTARHPQSSVWIEGENTFYRHGPADRDTKLAASAGECLGAGFGRSAGHQALYLAVCPAVGEGPPDLAVRYARAAAKPAHFDLFVDLEKAGEVVFADTGGWGDEPGHWRFARLAVPELTPGLHKISLVATTDGDGVNIDGFFVMAGAAEPPALPDSGRHAEGLEEQIIYLPGSVDYDSVRYLMPDPAEVSEATDPVAEATTDPVAMTATGPVAIAIGDPTAEPAPTLLALRGGTAGDPAAGFPEAVSIPLPPWEPAIELFHLLALVAGPRGWKAGPAAEFRFVFDDGSRETVPFPDLLERTRGKDGTKPPAHAAERAEWRFLALPHITEPCVRLSYAPPPGRFVSAIEFRKVGGAGRPEIPVLLGATKEIPPTTGRLPVHLGQDTFHGQPVSLGLTGTDFVPMRETDGRRTLLRALQLEPGAADDFTLVVAVERKDDAAARAACDKAGDPDLFKRHVRMYRRWFEEFAPAFTCSDPYLEKLWLYRWFLVRHCMLRPDAPPLTAPIFFRGMRGERDTAILAAATPHVLAETRWLRDRRFAVGQLRAHLRTMAAGGEAGGLFRDVRPGRTGAPARAPHWIPAAAMGVYRVHDEEQYLKEVLGLLARNVDATLTVFDADGDGWLETQRRTSFVLASCESLAEGFALLGDRRSETFYHRQAAEIREAARLMHRDVLFDPWRAPDDCDAFIKRHTRLHFEDGDLARPILYGRRGGESGDGPDLFDSACNDLLIRFVGGLTPASGGATAFRPLVRSLDHFRFSRIRYHGRELEIVWVRPGTPSPYADRPEGYTILVDGIVAAHRPDLEPVTVDI